MIDSFNSKIKELGEKIDKVATSSIKKPVAVAVAAAEYAASHREDKDYYSYRLEQLTEDMLTIKREIS